VAALIGLGSVMLLAVAGMLAVVLACARLIWHGTLFSAPTHHGFLRMTTTTHPDVDPEKVADLGQHAADAFVDATAPAPAVHTPPAPPAGPGPAPAAHTPAAPAPATPPASTPPPAV
jgi:hypothetical protein